MIDTRRRIPAPPRRRAGKAGRYFLVVTDPGTGKSGQFVKWGATSGDAWDKAQAQYRDEQNTPTSVALVCTLSHLIIPKVAF